MNSKRNKVKKNKYIFFPTEVLLEICKQSNNIYPYLLLFDQYYNKNIIKLIQSNSFRNFSSPYELLEFYIEDILLFEKYNVFNKSRYYANLFLKYGDYDKYINFLFFVKLYTYYLKVKIRKVLVKEFIFQYNLKYPNKIFEEKINTTDIECLLDHETDATTLEHYVYELFIKIYVEKFNLDFENINEEYDFHFKVINFFYENNNILWIKRYWKYIEKTDIYKCMFAKKLSKNFSYIYSKYKRDFESIIALAYFIENIKMDSEYIFNKANKIKNVKIYNSGYTNQILQEIDFILRNANNPKKIREKFDLENLYNIYFYKTTLNIDYFTINLFKSISGEKLEKEIIEVQNSSNSIHTLRCPYRSKDRYYKSKKFEVPFTRINRKYLEDPDNFIINYNFYLKCIIEEICKNLGNQIGLLTKDEIPSSRRIKFEKYSEIVIKLINSIDKDFIHSENEFPKEMDKLYFEIFQNDEFFKYFIFKFITFIISPKINRILSKYKYDYKIINFYLDNIKELTINKKSICFLNCRKIEIENLLKVYIFFFFNMRNKSNLIILNEFLEFIEEKFHYFYTDFKMGFFINILNDFRYSYCISKTLYVDNNNAYKIYYDILHMCSKYNICFKKCQKFIRKKKSQKNIGPKEIYDLKLNYFYFDLKILFDLKKKCEIFNKSFDENETYYIFSEKIIEFKPLIINLFKNNINLFFSFISNKMSDIFENDLINMLNNNLYVINFRKLDNLMDIFEEIDFYPMTQDEYYNRFNEDGYYSGSSISSGISSISSSSSRSSSSLYIISKFENTGKTKMNNYEKFEIFKKFFDEYKHFPLKSSSLKIDNLYRIIKSNRIEVYNVCLKYLSIIKNIKKNSIFKNLDITKSENLLKNEINNYINKFPKNSINNNSINISNIIIDIIKDNEIKYTEIYKRLSSSNGSYSGYGMFIKNKDKTDMIKICIKSKVNQEFFLSYNEDLYLKFFEDEDKVTKDNKLYGTSTYKHYLNIINKDNTIPLLNIDYEFFDDHMKFLDNIIKLIDKDLTYNYKYLTIKLYEKMNSFYNVKFDDNYYYFFECYKYFYILTIAIYILNSSYRNNFLYNTIENFNYCYFNGILKHNVISKWLNWTSKFRYNTELYSREEEKYHESILLKKNIFENLNYYHLKDYCCFDEFSNINRTMLASFLYYINENNIFNTINNNLQDFND